MKTILALLLCAATCSAVSPPAPPGFRVTYKQTPKRGAELLIAKTTALKAASVWVMPSGTSTVTPLPTPAPVPPPPPSRFAPASVEPTLTPRPMSMTVTGTDVRTVCVETTQQAGETIVLEYSTAFTSWRQAGPPYPPLERPQRVAFCFSDYAASLPPALFFRVRAI